MTENITDVDRRLRRVRRLDRRGDLEGAEAEARALLADLRLMPEPPLASSAHARISLARVLLRRAAPRAARLELEQLFRDVQRAQDESKGPPDAEIALALIYQAWGEVILASLDRNQNEPLSARRRIEDAIGSSLRRALVILENQHEQPDIVELLARIARNLMEQDEAHHAERLLRLELQERERSGHSLRHTSRARIHLAQCLMRQDKPHEAEGLFRTALEQRRRAGAPPDALTKATSWLAMCMLAQGKADEAETLLLSDLRELRELGEHPEARAALRYSLARVNLELNRPEEAKAMLRKGLEDLSGSEDGRALSDTAVGLAQLLQADGEKDEAEAVLLRTLRTSEARGMHPGVLQQLRLQLARARGEVQLDSSSDAHGTLMAFSPSTLGIKPPAG